MGRPSRKRPRPPPPSLVDSSRFEANKPRELLRSSVSRFEECGSIQYLVIKGPPPKSNGNPDGETATTTTSSVQQVWGALDQADVAAILDVPGLILGVHIDVDEAGIGWLLHTPRQSSPDQDRPTGLSEKHCCSQHGVSSLGPQQHQATSAANTSAAGTDSSPTTTLGPPCPEDNPRSASDCHSSGRQEQGEQDTQCSFCVCDTAVRAELSRVKDEFDDIPPAVFKRARSACNPAEALGSGLFLNRSAMKLANIDAVAGLSTSCSGPLPIGRVADHDVGGGIAGETKRVGDGNCRLNGLSHSYYYSAAATAAVGNRDEKRGQQGAEETEQQRQQQGAGETEQPQQQQQQQQQRQGEEPKQQKQPQQQEQEHRQEQRQASPREGGMLHHGPPPPPFLFADLCGGPGGFSEYLLRRRRQLGLPARGWGISLRGGGAEPTPKDCRTIGNGCDGSRSASRDKTVTSHACNGEHDGDGGEGRQGNFRHGHFGVDSCAWRLDHISPWCDVSTETGELAEAPLVCEGDVGRCADSEYVRGASARRVPDGGARPESLESLAISGKDSVKDARPLARDTSICGNEHGGRGGQLCERDAGDNRGRDTVAEVKNGGGGDSDMHHAHVVNSVAAVPRVAAANPSPRPRPTTFATASTTVSAAAMATAAVAANSTTAAAANSATAAATTTSITAPPLLEMRINYGPAGTGDLADEENMYGFVDAVMASTEGRRLDLVVADGGFEAARDSGEQECLMSSLVHYEALAALLLLEEGGSFVCKLFEVWTEPTASLVYLLHRKFRRIAIVKPITSRPASGERYLVCVGLLPPPLPTRCRFTDDLRAKVHALQRRSGHGPAAANSGSTGELPTFKAGRGRGRSSSKSSSSSENGSGSGGVACHAVANGASALDVSLEMKADAGFLSFLRLSNDRLASLQTQACARIIDVASSKRGRAWAFRDSKGRVGDRGGGVPSGMGDGEGADEGDRMGDEAALQCFKKAWRLDKLEGVSLR